MKISPLTKIFSAFSVSILVLFFFYRREETSGSLTIEGDLGSMLGEN